MGILDVCQGGRTVYQVLSAGGWVMPFIVLCSIIALAVCIERRFAPSQEKIAPPHLLATGSSSDD
jgi:biopolymer transport protein ExbB